MSDMLQIANNFGVPVALLFAICVFLWRLLVWLKPWGERILSAHLDFIRTTRSLVEALIESQKKQEGTLSQMASSHEQQTGLLDTQTGLLSELKEASLTHNQLMAALQCNKAHA